MKVLIKQFYASFCYFNPFSVQMSSAPFCQIPLVPVLPLMRETKLRTHAKL
jgi:hypothetical protein